MGPHIGGNSITPGFSVFQEGYIWPVCCNEVMVKWMAGGSAGFGPSCSFMPLHWFTLLPDLQHIAFPSDGLSWSQFQQALIKMKFLVYEAMVPDNLAEYCSYSGPNYLGTLFLTGLDKHLMSTQHPVVQEQWPRMQKCCMALAYKLFETLVHQLVQWIDSHLRSLSLLAKVSTILLNQWMSQCNGDDLLLTALCHWE